MITVAQWQAMNSQQQFDYVRMLEDTVDALELRAVPIELADDVPADVALPPYLRDTLMGAGITP